MGDAVMVSSAANVEPDMLTGQAPIVVLAPHPDDESLGCGGLLCHAFAHEGAHVICMTDGSASHPGSRAWPPGRIAAERRQELSRAIGRLGGGEGNVTWLGHPDGGLGAQDPHAIVADVAAICRARGARRLFAPAPEDHHADHKWTARIARRTASLVPGLVVFSYPVWSRWDDPDLISRTPARFALDTEPWRDAKRAAIAAHATQLGQIIGDDPTGFSMPPGFATAFADQPEIYWEATA